MNQGRKKAADGKVNIEDFRRIVGEYTALMNDPDPSIVDDAVGLVVEACDPLAVYVYGPSYKGYVDDRQVYLLVVVPNGTDTTEIRWSLRWTLACEHIYGIVSVVTLRDFRRYRDNSYSVVYDAVKTGGVAYAVDTWQSFPQPSDDRS